MAESSRKKNVDIVKKPGAKAPVWKFFGVRNQIENNSAVCRICGQDVPTKGGTTSCMISHLKNHHPPQYEEIHKSKRKLPGLNAELASTSKCTRAKLNYFNTSEDNVTNSNLDFVKLIENPNSDNSVAADKESIITDLFGNAKVMEILQNFSSNLTLPDDLHFNQVVITNRYEKLKKQIELELNEVQFVAVAIDSMMDFRLDNYFNITCRFITSEWKMKSRTLQTIFVPHILEELLDSAVPAVKEITDMWSITEKVVATTSCCCALKWEKVFHRAAFCCMRDSLNFVLDEFFESDILKPIHLVVEKLFFAFSYGIKKQALKEAQISLNLPVQQLRVESKSLWYSWYWSFRRILDQKPAIEKIFTENNYFTFACPPSQEQYDVIKDVCDVLKPLVDIIEKLSNSKNMIVSMLLPLYKQLKKSLEKDSSDSKVVADLKKRLIVELRIFIKIHGDQEKKFALKSSFLDPRFKNFLDPDEQCQVLCELSSEAAEKMSSFPTSGAYVSGDVNDETILRSADSFQFIFEENEYSQVTINFPIVMQPISKEIHNYLIEPVIDEAEDPLEWWRNKELQYRHLAILARKYLCCYATCFCARIFNYEDCCQQPFPLSKYLSEDGVNISNFLLRNS